MYLTNLDGSLKRDKLGRRIHVNQRLGWAPINKLKRKDDRFVREFDTYYNFMCTKEMLNELKEMAKRKGISRSELTRRYLQWGLDDDKVD